MVSTFYAAKTGGSAVTSITTDSNGAYLAWIDNSDYAGGSIFSLILSKSTHKEVPVHFGLPGLSFKDATETLTNKTLTLPQINDTSGDHQYIYAVNELSANRTITLPLLTANATFAFLSFAQAWSALQTFNQGMIRFGDTSDDHHYILKVKELTANRDITLPLLTANDEFVFKDFIQTLTNKTLTAPTLTAPTLTAPTSDDLTLTGSAASTPDANTITKDHLIGARCTFNGTGTPAYIEEINFSGAITDGGNGIYTLTIDRDFANGNYVAIVAVGANGFFGAYMSKAVGSLDINIAQHDGVNTDQADISVVLIGAQ